MTKPMIAAIAADLMLADDAERRRAAAKAQAYAAMRRDLRVAKVADRRARRVARVSALGRHRAIRVGRRLHSWAAR